MMLKLPALVATALLPACVSLQPPPETPNTYVLDARITSTTARPRSNVAVAVSMPRARAGFDTAQMAYVRRPYELDYFAKNRWADTPSRMLAPLLTQALEHGANLRAVVQAPSTASADVRLDVEIVRLFQDFSGQPSRIRFSLRAQLVELASQRVLATREFDEVESAPREDPYGGVIAANRALERLLGRIVEFCAEQIGNR
jgi:cholesterol transport system auxiliary component